MTTTNDIEQAIDRCIAENNLPRALYWKGRLSALNGDWQSAVSFYREAAENNDLYGICELGRCYREGLGVDIDFTAAHEFARRAGKMGDFGGCFDVGKDYYRGNGVPMNNAEAALWFERASQCDGAAPDNRAVALIWAGDSLMEMGSYDEALNVYLKAASFVECDLQYGHTYATCLGKAGFLEWTRARPALAMEYWEKEQQILYEYSKFDAEFDYATSEDVDRVVKNINIAKGRIEGLLDTGIDALGALL